MESSIVAIRISTITVFIRFDKKKKKKKCEILSKKNKNWQKITFFCHVPKRVIEHVLFKFYTKHFYKKN